MRCFLFWVILISLLRSPVRAATNQVAAANLKVWVDRDLYDILPDKFLFENLPSKLFRSRDGKILFVGPAAEKQYFTVRGPGRIEKQEAPAKGKAYQDEQGRFVIWYDSLKEGIHFAGGYILRLSQPHTTRFGVGYGADFFYLYDGGKSEIFARSKPTRPLIQLEGHYVYKIAGNMDSLYVFCFRRLTSESVRHHLLLEYREIENTYVEMKRYELPDHLSTLDVDLSRKKLLMLNDSEMAPQAIEHDLVTGTWKNHGIVDYFALYLDADFLNEPENKKETIPPPRDGVSANP